MENTPREKFFEGMRTAPFSAHQFVSAIHDRYDRRNDVEVHYTDTNASDLRLRVFWENAKGSSHQQNFARFEWRAQKGHFYCETYLSPEELNQLGFEDTKEHRHGPLLAQVRVTEEYWAEGDACDVFFRSLDLACVNMTLSR